jgi:transposase
MQAARQRQQTQEFKEQYKLRAGMEGSLSQGVRRCGLRRSRYVGEAKTRLQELFIATALNIARVSTFLAGEAFVERAEPPFVRLMQALA